MTDVTLVRAPEGDSSVVWWAVRSRDTVELITALDCGAEPVPWTALPDLELPAAAELDSHAGGDLPPAELIGTVRTDQQGQRWVSWYPPMPEPAVPVTT